ncbi:MULTISPECIES: hypothetical protein [unclassified Sphingomonas]|uniref:hypothetical protein n=1 Tax=unclassified Sphingomonas TaxID=196159 RepID=UPI001AD24D6E|nr:MULTISPECIES: hypothetical protein [unclassified Sphingomonas]MBN8848144.1 hypothetical protein [Sphingomonas sp.]
MRKALTWFRSRLVERSTLAGVGTAAAAAAVLPWPWSVISFAVGVAVAFIPDGKV